MTDEELQDFCLVIMFAGHDTTCASMQTMLHFLHTNPSIWAELRGEVEGAWDGKAAPTWTQVCACLSGKCGRFVSEVLRVLPPAPNIYRTVEKDVELLGY